MRILLPLILLFSASPLFGMLRLAQSLGVQTIPRLSQSAPRVAPILLRRSYSNFTPLSGVAVASVTELDESDVKKIVKHKRMKDLEESFRISKELESAASDRGEREFFDRLAQFHRAKLMIPFNKEIAKLVQKRERAWTDWGRRSCENQIEELEKKKAAFTE